MSRLVSWLLPCVLLGLGAGVPSTALAQEAPRGPAQSTGVKVAEHVRRGLRARDAGRWADAQSEFESALGAVDTERTTPAQRAEILGELGLCELQQRKYRDAAEHLAKSLEDYQSLRPEVLRRVKAGERKARSYVGRVYLAVSPADAAVILDGRPLGRAVRAYELFVEPGRHTIRARLTGYGDGVATFDVAAGADHSAALTLPRAPEPAAGAPTDIPKQVPSQAVSQPAPVGSLSTASTLSIIGVAFTGAALMTGGVFLALAADKEEELWARGNALRVLDEEAGACLEPDGPPACSELRRLDRSRDLLSGIGWASLVAGGAVGLVTMGYLLVGHRKPAGDRVQVLPLATAQYAGFVARGHW